MCTKTIQWASFASMCLAILISSCRESSDDVLCYAGDSNSVFSIAGESFSNQFEAVWTALNCNYNLWDYEAENGLDWDAVRKEYAHRFKELDDKRAEGTEIENSVLRSLYEEILAPLHDGHLVVEIKNLSCKEQFLNYVTIKPSLIRNKKRENFSPDSLPYLRADKDHLRYYYTDAPDDMRFVEHDEKTNPYNKWDFTYAYARLADNILYFRLKECELSRDLNYDSDIRRIWQTWFNTTKELHDNGTLKGLVIDLRNNPGGNFSDYKYVLGCLQAPEEEIGEHQFVTIGYQRAKNGIGRLDFAPTIPFRAEIYSDEHPIIDEPIVLLANTYTGSMAEILCLAAKDIPNAKVLGTRTWGALCALPEDYNVYYSGTVGSSLLIGLIIKGNQTPFYAYIPSIAFYGKDGGVLEGKGVEPDRELAEPFDTELYLSTGRDNQLERALRYIRTGK